MIRAQEGSTLERINLDQLNNDKSYLSFLLKQKENDEISENKDKVIDNKTQIYGLDIVYKIQKRTPFK